MNACVRRNTGDSSEIQSDSSLTTIDRSKVDVNELSQRNQKQPTESGGPNRRNSYIIAATDDQQQSTAAPSTSASAKVALKQQNSVTFSDLSCGSSNLRFCRSVCDSVRLFGSRNKSRKRLITLVNLPRSKTQWHNPITNSIFEPYFKRSQCSNNFVVDHLVAKGAFGVVFKVSNRQKHPKSYALKVLKKSKIIEENNVRQILAEADIQRAISHHDFFAKQIAIWQNRYNLHILSEYVPNGELCSKITTFSIDLVRFYMAEIACAIDYLHNSGIIYRDAKSENILLTEHFHIKLTDFGLSKWLRLGARTQTVCGTYKYMGTIL